MIKKSEISMSTLKTCAVSRLMDIWNFLLNNDELVIRYWSNCSNTSAKCKFQISVLAFFLYYGPKWVKYCWLNPHAIY